ncbi:hypothetical protein AMK26_05690 [Streptomyces sp. CB03234]|uniref:hypothetical protein n=1 Tax=Streptomyces sp. (strain CB03234) TaxID=1703937 RepID=UPI00095BC861|nr:hypothetical protein AMK26_05690 [Streptomyces sp. CB03234]
MTPRRLLAAAALTPALLLLPAPTATAADTPGAAVTAPATLDTLSRFFARDGAVTRAAAHPRIEGSTVPVRVLSPDFVAGRAGAPVARVEFHAAGAVSSDGQKASVWTARQGAKGWQVVNIATGDDEIRYAREGARRLPGGTVFREPQIDAWYVHKGSRVLPLDEDAIRAVGARGTTLAAYRERVAAAYGDKLPGTAYARKGAAGGYGGPASGPAARPDAPPAPAVAAAGDRTGLPPVPTGAAALCAVALALTGAWRLRRHRRD